MPLIQYCGTECLHSCSHFYRNAKDAPSTVKCQDCAKSGKERGLKRAMRAPSSTSVITVDNGVQARATEVNLEIVEDIKERSTKDFKKD